MEDRVNVCKLNLFNSTKLEEFDQRNMKLAKHLNYSITQIYSSSLLRY